MNNLFWLTFSCIKGVGDVTVKELYFQHPYANFELINDAFFLESLKPSIRNIFLNQEVIISAENKAIDIIKKHEQHDIKVVPISSEYYPISLRFIKDPPAVLYAKGNLELLKDMNLVAIVGTREPTPTGEVAARKIASTFANYGYTIVSGLALGIDTAGHEGALKIPNGKTIAVMADNLTKIYPAKNKKLAESILLNKGLLLSEVSIGQGISKGSFVKRDRIQSGLSLGVCPVQTPIKSGTQHTIQFAREQERVLFTPIVMDIDLNHIASQGNLKLLKEEKVIDLKDQNTYPIIISRMNDVKKQLLLLTESLNKKSKPKNEEIRKYEQGSLF